MDLGPGIDRLPDTWVFDLALAYLTAAQSCGFTCERVWVADSSFVESCCDPCQLVAKAEASWVPDTQRGAGGSLCLPYLKAEITLVLDQCVYVPEGDEHDSVKATTNAQANITARTQIMRGLQTGHAAGMLAVACGKVVPTKWVNLWTEGGCTRWQTVWTVTI